MTGPGRARVPPERIELDGMVLRRLALSDAAAVAAAINDSLDHLRPWMPWATDEVTADSQRAWLAGAPGTWHEGGEYHFAIVAPDAGLVGCCGLNRRAGPGALDVGYWVHAAHTRRGIATAAARALTDAGFGLEGIERMEIHCDEANAASAAVAVRLGYRLLRSEELEFTAPGAPGGGGTRLVWAVDRLRWRRGR